MGCGVSFLIAATTGVGARRRARIHDDDAVLADLDADVAAGTGDHEEIRPKLQDFEVAGRRAGRAAGAPIRLSNAGAQQRRANATVIGACGADSPNARVIAATIR